MRDDCNNVDCISPGRQAGLEVFWFFDKFDSVAHIPPRVEAALAERAAPMCGQARGDALRWRSR